MCCLSCLWFVLGVVPLCGFTLQQRGTSIGPWRSSTCQSCGRLLGNVCALHVVGFIVGGVFCLFACFVFIGSWFYHELWANFRFMEWDRASAWFASHFPPDRREVLTLTNPCSTWLSIGTILSGSLERTFPLFQGFSCLQPRRAPWQE